MTAFLIVAGIGLAMLVISGIVGEFLELLDFVDLGVSSLALSLALLTFGSAGALATTLGVGTLPAIAIALASGAAFAVGGQKFVNHLVASDDGDAAYELKGLLGKSTSTIGPNGGEVRLSDPRELETRLAWSDEVIEPGTAIEVIEYGEGRVKVATTRNDAHLKLPSPYGEPTPLAE